ncbi:alpha-1,4-glucan--maltose-1-phosphate maltosyltransferase [Granulicoccus phenolivorans]|uniref:alpha-1,4-glucan--maltose-1-phosphate maltosyltransferase n=1 Tax=Granulicoccus phenolivorans TaxID=266854 RepID=UPI00247FB195|nr:alpha-1,4-glucan--maltose-1-phosphate maltosyltransferase [Granulicoccus phenolivorans]
MTEQTPGSPARPASDTHLHSDLGTIIGRIPVTKVSPVIEGGAYAAKATVGEEFPIRATVFREGHDAVGASVILTGPDGSQRRVDMRPCPPEGWNRWEALVRLDEPGAWTFRIEAWDDPYHTWVHHAEIKLPAGIDLNLVCLEGQALFAETADNARAAGDHSAAHRLESIGWALDPNRDVPGRLDHLMHPDVPNIFALFGPRRFVSPTPDYPLFVDRRRALFSAWYEFFPRSQGAHHDEATGRWVSGTFDSSHERLEAAAAMGFDVVYLPPIHPIGEQFRKGPNNTLTPAPGDPGSPWAIGGAAGGHDAIHPDLGDLAAFDRFVHKAHSLGLEVALDFALQASPDHPWVREHPEWFSERPDGTIAYAENPPKKYQDIYPINFDRDRAGIYHECLRILRFWMEHGVRIFRVDNPHTKPVEFWAWLLAEVRRTDPDVLFLAEAFTKPEMMHLLGKVGFQQSYTYFTWRNEKWELQQYLHELSQEMDGFYRPNFFVNTPDINPRFLQHSGPAGFTIRAVLAATMSPTWGVYSGFELFEAAPLKPGGEEYLDSEKYQYRPRDWSGGAQGNLSMLLGKLNWIRNQQPALQQLRRIRFHSVSNDQIIAYSKRDGDSVVLTVVSLDPHHTQEGEVFIDLPAVGLASNAVLSFHDELTEQSFSWGAKNFVRLTPANPAHILVLQ